MKLIASRDYNDLPVMTGLLSDSIEGYMGEKIDKRQGVL